MLKRKKKASWQKQLLMIFAGFAGIVFLPTTMILVIGMLPTFVAAAVTSTKKKAKAMTVGAMNLAGITPFLIDLWVKGHNFDTSFDILTDPTVIIVMYSAACVGYLIDWITIGFVSAFMYKKGEVRLKYIEDRQQELIQRWGEIVNGETPLNEYGFPKEPDSLKDELSG